MKKDAALAVGEVLFPVLSGFQGILGHPLRAVWQVEDDACLARIVLEFDALSLLISAVPDDDTIDFGFAAKLNGKTGGVNVSELSPWEDFVGVPFGWGWLMVNQQGYCDGMLLSFGDVIFPQIVLNVVASSIKVGRVSEISER